jgi:hypothetical protein
MKARKQEYDRIRYSLKRELKIDKTGIEPRTYKRFNPTQYGSIGCSNTTIDDIDNFKMKGGTINNEPLKYERIIPYDIQIQLDYAKLNYSPDAYEALLKTLNHSVFGIN